jgi:EamA domain-containing membrane protein RarD
LLLVFGLATFLVLRSGVPWWACAIAFSFGLYTGQTAAGDALDGFFVWLTSGFDL